MKDKDYIIIIFIVLFVIYYMTIVIKDYKGVFFIIILFAVIYIQYINKKTLIPENFNSFLKNILKKENNSNLFLDNKETELINDKNGIEENTFYTRKSLNNIKFIKNSKEINHELFRLKIIEKYDKELFNKIIYLTEHFLKLHYKIMMGFYEFEQHFNVIKDIRQNLLNHIKSIVYVTPKIDEELINDICDNIQGLTHRYLKILQLKYKKSQYIESPPYEYDPSQNNNFNIY
jgi:hypothetical protein